MTLALVAAAPTTTSSTTAGGVRPSRSLDELALRAQRGEPGAADALVERLLVRLRPLVRYRVLTRARGALTEADVDDVLQDVVLLIWQQDLRRFDPGKSGFLTFVSRRLGWHLADRARHARRRRGEELDDVELEEVVDHGKDPAALLAARDAERALLALPARIAGAGDVDEQARTAVVRYDLEGASLAEVARELQVHVSNACRARQRGLQRLARHLAPLAA